MESLRSILFIAVMRWAHEEDKRFALTALATYQVLSGPYRTEALKYVKSLLEEGHEIRIANAGGDPEKIRSLAASYGRGTAIIQTLQEQKTGLFASWRTKSDLEAIAPELRRAIESYDEQAVGDFERREIAHRT